MTGVDPADAPLDDVDEAILDQVRAMHADLDPPPPDLDDRTRFAIRLENLDFEVSRLYEDTLGGVGARAGEPVRTVTFESDSLTIMMTISPPGGERVRVEGWLAPPGPLPVELRVADPAEAPHRGRSHRAVADHSGRFVFDEVAAGLAQLTVHRGGEAGDVVTSPLLL